MSRTQCDDAVPAARTRRSPRPGPAGLLAALLLAVAGGSGGRGSEAWMALLPPPAAGSDAAYDTVATDAARVLAGLEPAPGPLFDRIKSRLAWQVHRAKIDSDWSRFEIDRVTKMRNWRERELKTTTGRCDTLFYPFGGPDFANAFVLFPHCDRYLLFGLEPVGSIPPLTRSTDERFDAVLERLRDSLSDLFVRNYFITNSMMQHLRTPEIDGTMPLMLVFIARFGGRVVDVRMGSPWDEAAAGAQGGGGRHAAQPAKRATAVTIRFRMPAHPAVQTLCYARVRMEDSEFEKQAGLLDYMDRAAPFTTFLKSASYLMHDDRFSRVRSVILKGSQSVLEDDSGVPYRFFKKAGWDVTLYGRYSPPVKDFNYGLQRDLEAAYRETPAARDLPFTFGYHWRDGESSVILAVRRGEAQ